MAPITDDRGDMKHQQFPDLFALIIGINTYSHSQGTNGFRDLTFCASDADAIAEFLQVKLGVPNQNIRNLRDLEATRANIISGIQALGSDDRIKKDSPIFIFYAGHGATSLHLHSELQYEVVCPSDVTIHSEPIASNPANEKISGIPDYEVQRLVNEVAREKGNNITLFLDCCHSAGMNRNVSVASERRIANPSPLSDMDFPVERRRDGDIIPASVGRNYQSHVMLAACGKNESAKECQHTQHGWLTAALLRLFNKVPIENFTYDTLLTNLEITCPQCIRDVSAGQRRQTPHCDGFNIERQIFRTTTLRSSIRGRSSGSSLTIPCGSIAGILPQSRFYVYVDEDLATSPLGLLIATGVTVGGSTLDFLPDHPKFAIPEKFFVKQLNRFKNFSVFCVQLNLGSIFPQHELFGIVPSDNKESSDAWVELEGNDALVYRGQHRPENVLLGNLLRKLPLTKLPRILNASAAFYHHLLRTSPSNFDQVSVKLVHLALGEYDATIESVIDIENVTNPNSLFTKRATVFVDSPIDDKLWTKPLGMQLQNPTMDDLYPYVFIFTPSSLTIQSWHSIAHADMPDSPLPRKSYLNIGFEGNALPWGFYLDPAKGEIQDVAYIKIFFTTTPCPELDQLFKTRSVLEHKTDRSWASLTSACWRNLCSQLGRKWAVSSTQIEDEAAACYACVV
ncbi:caspase domain-containing protein [Gymnopilus junonius]|uniref:Caspase domain-containing protein n=1 Tax=Gymnopilus junonius TaxID=109634 RepID=A0A9P5NII6_GYMJU|nr:caspase domain-containing protein [Gymnopilus junonius]